jgi:hypothetical protein
MLYLRRLRLSADYTITHATRPTLRAHIVGEGQERRKRWKNAKE